MWVSGLIDSPSSCLQQSPTPWWPAYIMESDVAVSGPLLSPTLWCPAYRRVRLRGGLYHGIRLGSVWSTAKSDSVVSCLRGIRFGGVRSTAESDSVVSCLPWNPIWRCLVHCRVRLCGVLPTVESDLAVSSPLQSLSLWCPAYTVPKVIDFPRYNIQCSGENVILRGIVHVVSVFLYKFM